MEEYKRYDEYKDSGVEWIGEIPQDWSIVSMKYLVDITTGNKDTVDRNPEGEYPFFVRSDNVEKIDTYSYDGKAILTPGDGDIGEIFHYINGKFDFHQRVYKISEFKNIYPKYLYYYMMTNFKSDVKKLSAKTTVDSLRMPMFKNFKVLNFSTIEQKKIASFLDKKTGKIDKIINRKENLIEKLKEYKKSVITEAVTKGKLGDKYINENGELVDEIEMKDSGVDWLGKIPEYFKLIKLKLHFKVNSGDYISNNEKKKGNIPLYGGNGFNEYINKSNVSGNTVIIGRVGALCGNVHLIEGKSWITDNSLYLKKIKEDISFKFVYYNLKALRLNRFSTKTAQPLITATLVKNMKIIYINQNIQNKIICYIENKIKQIDNLITKTENSIKKYKEYKKSLIFEAVTGKLDLRDYVVEEGEESVKHNNTRKAKRESLSRVN